MSLSTAVVCGSPSEEEDVQLLFVVYVTGCWQSSDEEPFCEETDGGEKRRLNNLDSLFRLISLGNRRAGPKKSAMIRPLLVGALKLS